MVRRKPAAAGSDDGYPKEFDPKFHGPIEKRGCTDVICLLLFIAFQIGWIAVAVIAFKQGDPSVLVHPVDSWGQKCGLDPSVANKPFLYFFDITKCASASVLIAGCPTTQVCVEKCPEEGPWLPQVDIARYGDNSNETKAKMICQYSVDKSQYTVSQLLTHNRCAKYILPVKPISRRCIPRSLNRQAMAEISEVNKDVNLGAVVKGVDKLVELLNAKQNFEFMFEDFRASWPIILTLLVSGAVASLVWICLMRCFAAVMVWLSLVGMMFVLGFSTYFSVVKYIELRGEESSASEMLKASEDPEAESERFITEEDLVNQFDTALKLKNTWLTFAIIAGSLLAILLLIVLVIRSRLAIAVALIRQGARAVGDITFALAWPLVPWILQLVAIGFFLLVGVFLVSASEEVYRVTQNCTCGLDPVKQELILEGAKCHLKRFTEKCGDTSECILNNACQFSMYQKLSNVLYYHLYNFFAIIWMLCFISDFGDMVLAGTFAGWYWTLNRSKDLATFPVSKSLLRTTRYHLGTIAFGSLIISIIKFIRYFLEYLDYKLRQYNENPVAKAVLCCMKCCFWCLEKFMKFVNRNAYIMVAVYGQNFCTSARDAFFLLMRNAVRAFVLDKVTDFLLFMGKLVIVGGVAISSFYIFAKQHPALQDEVPVLHFYLMPVIVITVGTYFITTLFFSVYNMAVDTLFLCFLEDSEVNDGSEEKPYYMPKELMGILGKKNKIPVAKNQVEA